MKASVFETFDKNPRNNVRLKDIDTPKVSSDEVLIRIEASAYNYNDLWALWGDPIKVPLPHISGSDAAGEVVEVGNEVKSIRVGDKVVSHSNLSDRTCSLCTSGREYDCPNRRIWGFETGPLWGGFSQYTHLPEVNVLKIPDELSYNQAAALSMVGLTAWHMLVTRCGIRPGQVVLIMGGGSGLGTVGIQIAKLFNCRVIATAGTKEKMESCLSLGADAVANHRENDWYRKVREQTKTTGIDVIFEHIGGSIFSQAVTLLRYGGTIVTAGATTGYDAKVDLRHLFFKGTNWLGSTQGNKAELEQLIRFAALGKIKAVIDTIYPFSDMVNGHVKMAEGLLFGKLLTTPQKM